MKQPGANESTTGGTIFAPATAAGRAGVAIIRISGPEAGSALRALSVVAPVPRHAGRARFRDPATGETIDSGIALWFPAPASFTGEDVAELQVHGSRAVVDGLLRVLSTLPGCRMAEPGEFTKRAFLNGKLDLTAAEGLADLVAAETEAQRRQSLRQLDGELGRLYDSWRASLMRALAHTEAAIDFPEEDLPAGVEATAACAVAETLAAIEAHLADDRRGERVREGVAVAILGPPNAGKSSLLNALARRDVAITSAVAGTTRDIIEVHLDLGGYPVVVADTAGLRQSTDPVEAEGVRRALRRAEAADLRLVLYDAGSPEERRSVEGLLGPNAILVGNKADLLNRPADSGHRSLSLCGRGRGPCAAWDGEGELPPAASESRPHPGPLPQGEGESVAADGALLVSVLTGRGITALVSRLESEVAARFGAASVGPTRLRHRRALEECAAALRRFDPSAMPELAAEDLRLAVRALGRITGRVDVEDMLDIVFREFCIGK